MTVNIEIATGQDTALPATKEKSAVAAARTIARGASISFAGIVVSQIIRFFSSVLIARYLGPNAFGLFHLAKMVMMTSIRISIAGWLESAARFIAFYAGREQKSRVESTLALTFRVVGTLSLTLGFALFLLAGIIAKEIFQKPELEGILRLVAVAIPVGALGEILTAQIVGFRALRYKLYARDLLGSLGLISLLVILSRLDLGVTGMILAYLGSFVITSAVAWALLRRLARYKGYILSRSTQIATTVRDDIKKFAWPLILTKLLMLVRGNFSSLWLGYALTSDQVGLYGVVTVMGPVLTLIPSSFSDILLPSLSRSMATGDLHTSRSIYQTVRRWYIKLSVPMLLGIIAFPNVVIEVVYGPQYAPSAVVLRLFSLAYLIPCLTGPWFMSLLSSGRTKSIMITQITGASLTIGLNLLLVPSYGIVGAGIAFAVAVLVPNIIGVSIIYPTLRFQVANRGMFKSIGLDVGLLLLLYSLYITLFARSIWPMVPALAFYWILAVIGGFFLDGLNAQDRAVLSSFLAKVGLQDLAIQIAKG